VRGEREKLLSFVLGLAIGAASGEPYTQDAQLLESGKRRITGSYPDDEIWRTLASRAGLQPLGGPRSARLIRFGWAEYPGTIVTVLPTADGAQLEVAVLRNWREAGATVRTVRLSGQQYRKLQALMETGFWGQPPVAPTAAPGVTDGRMWYIEGLRDGKRHSIVRHEPNEPHIRALCSEFMSLIDQPDLVPHSRSAVEQPDAADGAGDLERRR
jgi:hypothetical protein